MDEVVMKVEIDLKHARALIAECLAPGAVLLTKEVCDVVYSKTGTSVRLMEECGAIVNRSGS